MDVGDQINQFYEFIEAECHTELVRQASKGLKFLKIDFNLLSKFNPELAEALLENPEDTIKAAELAIANFDVEGDVKNFKVRFANLPASQKITIRDIRAIHINKLIHFDGLVRQKSDVRPQVTSARFECPACGNIITVLQTDTAFKEPSRCSCGRKGRFRTISKELVDAQRIVLEEAPEDLDGGEQPKRMAIFLKSDLVSPLSDKKTNPGSKIVASGIVKEVPIEQHGIKTTKYDLFLEANHIEAVQEDFYDLEITEEEEQEILKLAEDPRIFEKLRDSLAPSIYGHERVKEAVLLQMFGGVIKKRDKGDVTRGDIHILIIGDPGCIAGNSQVALIGKGMEQIQNLGTHHGQVINERVVKIRKGPKDKPYDFAKLFQHYSNQSVLKIVTETGKEIIGTYNQPLMTRKGWTRMDELYAGDEIRVMPKIPTQVTKLANTGFERVKRSSGPLKEITVPSQFTPELASLCGYILGDGNIHSNGYRVTCYVNEEEQDLIGKISTMFQETFNAIPRITTVMPSAIKTMDDGNGQLRIFESKQSMTLIEINSKQVASCLSFLAVKQVPQQIFKSPKRVMAKFISWLFEADGCAFGLGRGRASVQLKSVSKKLLQDVQLLLLYFGIQSRIVDDNLCIRRSRDIELYAKHIGFNSEKKVAKLKDLLVYLQSRSYQQKRKVAQRYERIVSVHDAGVMDVYDFEVPKSHSFIANGILCHNSGKSQLLKKVSVIAPKSRYVSGKGASGAGLTASVVKDEFLKGWALEAGALVLTNKGICCIDELDKMTKEDQVAMHEGLEQQTITIAKANIQATLKAETTVLAAANPKFGRFDPFELIAKQIELPPTLMNRFDLIFPVRDLPDKDKDERLANFILQLHKSSEKQDSVLEPDIIKRYVSYARQRIRPKLTEAALKEIKDFFVIMRNSDGGGDKIKSIPISARQLEALIRLSEASAKSELRDKVTKKDAKKAIDLVHYSLSQIGLDPETGKIDIDTIVTGMPSSQRSNIVVVREIINELEKVLGKAIPMEDIEREAEIKGVSKDKTNEIIEKLRKTGDVYSPRHGIISRIE